VENDYHSAPKLGADETILAELNLYFGFSTSDYFVNAGQHNDWREARAYLTNYRLILGFTVSGFLEVHTGPHWCSLGVITGMLDRTMQGGRWVEIRLYSHDTRVLVLGSKDGDETHAERVRSFAALTVTTLTRARGR
jgi:hypothetical protein